MCILVYSALNLCSCVLQDAVEVSLAERVRERVRAVEDEIVADVVGKLAEVEKEVEGNVMGL